MHPFAMTLNQLAGIEELTSEETQKICGGMSKNDPITTLAIGEEGGSFNTFEKDTSDCTTLAIGEEGGYSN